MGKVPVTNKKRLIAAFAIFCVLLVALCVRDGYIQIVKGEEYTKMAMDHEDGGQHDQVFGLDPSGLCSEFE